MASPLLKFVSGVVGWRFIPDIISGQLLAIFHKYFYSRVLRRQIPPTNSIEYQRHRRLTYAAVVFGYAIYAFHGTATSIGANYYEILGVSPSADEGDLKLGFRAFARRHHPDRAGPQAERVFMEVRDAYEALKDPLTRFAYDRCAKSVLIQCRNINVFNMSLFQ